MIGIAILITYIVFQTEWFQIIKSGNFDAIIDQNIWFILAITLVIMMIQNTFTVIPLILVITVNYVLFGFIKGFLWSWITSLIGSTVIFLCSRYLFQGWVSRKVDASLRSKIEKNGFKFVFQARVIPFIPTSLINILSGVSSIPFRSFILATSIGNFLYFFMMTLIPAGLLNIPSNQYLIEASILLIILLIFYFTFKRKKRQTNYSEDKRNGKF